MPSQSDIERVLQQRKLNRQRFERAGMGLVPDLTVAPTNGTPLSDPSTAAQRAGDVTFVATLEHDGVPEGVIFQIDAGTGLGVVFGIVDFFGTWPSLQEGTSALATGKLNASGSLDGVHALSKGRHTYVWTVQKTAISGDTEGHVFVDGKLVASSGPLATGGLADWPSGDWTFGEQGATLLSLGSGIVQPVGDLTNATIIGNLEVFFHTRPAVVGGRPLGAAEEE